MNDTLGFETLERKNLGDIVYARISQGLAKGRFAPGERLTIRALALSLGTSVTPVRDAILRLIQDEALVQKSPRDVRVPIVTVERYQEIRQIRVKLEGLAAREAALRAGRVDIELLRALIKRNEKAIAGNNWLEALDINQTFHFALADIAGMSILRGILSRIWPRMGPLIAESYAVGGRVMIDNHYRVLKAIEAGDPDAAEQAIGDDITQAGRLIAKKLAQRLKEDTASAD